MKPASTKALQTKRDHLARALSDRTAQLELLTHEFEEFIHAVSHDLRAPLRAMEGFAQILREDHGAKLDTEGQLALEAICSGATKASLLVKDLVTLARLCGR